MELRISVSHGEVIDKITILQIKVERITNPDKLENVRRELSVLAKVWTEHVCSSPRLDALIADLKHVNESLWEVEDLLRQKESEGVFDAKFIELARKVYFTNDKRAALKREINELLGSTLVEEKDYVDYQT